MHLLKTKFIKPKFFANAKAEGSISDRQLLHPENLTRQLLDDLKGATLIAFGYH